MRFTYRFATAALIPFCLSAALGAVPTVSITSPFNNQQVSNVYQNQHGSDQVTVTGSVGGTNLKSWTLQYQLGSGGWTTIASGTAAISGTLGTWSTLYRPDGTFNLNGTYHLNLYACDTSNVCTYQTTINVIVANFYLTQTTPSGQPQINTPAGEKITYQAVLPWLLTITLSIYPQGSVTPIFSVGTNASGTWSYLWNGTKTGGTRAPDGPYFVKANVTDGTNSFDWDESSRNLTDGYSGFAYVTDPDFDPFNNDPLPISYNFNAGRVTIAVAPAGSGSEIDSTCSPPNFCVIDHKYEESGSHSLHWAGVDATGKFRPDAGMMAIVSEHAAFAKNAVVIYGTKPKVDNVTVTPPVAWSGASQTIAWDVTGPTAIASKSITIENQESLSVLRTINATAAICTGGGTHCSFVWDGKADNGMLVAPGAYTITVSATDSLQNAASSQGLAFIQE